MEVLLVLVVWGGIWAGLCYWLAGEKGRDQGGWAVAGFFFAFLALVVLGFSPSKRAVAVAPVAYQPPPNRPERTTPATSVVPPAATKKCPDCAEEVKAEARICRFCRYEFPATQPPEAATAPPTAPVASSGGQGYDQLGRWRVSASNQPNLRVDDDVRLSRSASALNIDLATWNRERFHLEEKLERVSAEGAWQGPRLTSLEVTLGRRYTLRLAPLDGQDARSVAADLKRASAAQNALAKAGLRLRDKD